MKLLEKKKLQEGTVPAADTDHEFSAADVEAVMKKYDRESNTRLWEGWQRTVVSIVMAAFSLFVIYVTLFATWLDLLRYPSFLGCILVIGYLIYPAKKETQRVNHMPWYDWVLMLVGTAAFFYIALNAQDITMRVVGFKSLHSYELVLGLFGIVSLVELCRRSVGLPILCVAGAFVAYALYYYLGVKGYAFMDGLGQLVYRLNYTTTGILSTPIQVCAKFIVVFIIFGAFLERTGISGFFIDLANCVAGSSSGGPAKVAVISSALCGMVSGSSVGNTVTTGSVTIPMMKKTGYAPEFAGAVEAAASTGGQIMPPIMGAAAFLMAEYVDMPYSKIIVCAILPAVLYFTGIFLSVHLEAKKLGLKGIPREELPRFSYLIRRIYLLLPLVILVALVSTGARTMAWAAAISIVAAIVVSLPGLFSESREQTEESAGKHFGKSLFSMIYGSLAGGAKSAVTVAVACGMAGIIAGCITMTGLASQLITAIITVSGGYQPVALVLTMLCCIVLGMGVPTTANYCIMASTCAPILIQLGIPKLAAHFFVFYFGIVADITPPVALAAYAGSAIAKSNPLKTGVNATKLAIAAFIIPYVFALNPQMLLIDVEPLKLVQIIITAALGMLGVCMGLMGYMGSVLKMPMRLLAIAGGLCMIIPGNLTDVVGLVILVFVTVVSFWDKIKNRRQMA